MRWVRYRPRGETTGACYGLLEGDEIVQVTGLPWEDPVPTGQRCRLAQARLLAPVVPPTFYAAGINYPRHMRHHLESQGKPVRMPTQSDIGYRSPSALVGHEDAIVVPVNSSGKVQFEIELAVVIGKRARYTDEQEVMSCVFGYSIGNDVSERRWQAQDRTLWRAKNCDTFKPMGPWIETDAPQDGMVSVVRLNGREVSRFATHDMIFSVATTLSAITRNVTLHPGDIVWMGTDEPTLDMSPGDVVELEISGIGVLRNPIVAEEAP